MKITGIAGTLVGSKVRTSVEKTLKMIKGKNQESEIDLIDFKDYKMDFCDGRPFNDYSNDTKTMIEKIISSDALIIGTNIFQSSIPGSLKNMFDLLPLNSVKNKVVGMIVVSGTPKHFLVADEHLKPILSFMKTRIIQSHVYIESYSSDPFNKDIIDRLNCLANEVIIETKYVESQKGCLI